MAGQTSSMNLRERLGYYFLGVAISCVIVGFFLSNRARARREAEAQMQGQTAPVQGAQPGK